MIFFTQISRDDHKSSNSITYEFYTSCVSFSQYIQHVTNTFLSLFMQLHNRLVDINSYDLYKLFGSSRGIAIKLCIEIKAWVEDFHSKDTLAIFVLDVFIKFCPIFVLNL